MEALKKKILEIYQKDYAQQKLKAQAEEQARKAAEAFAQKSLQNYYPEFLSLLTQAGLYQGLKFYNESGPEHFILMIGTQEGGSFKMGYDGAGKIQPNYKLPFDHWSLDRLIREVQEQLQIIPQGLLQSELQAV